MNGFRLGIVTVFALTSLSLADVVRVQDGGEVRGTIVSRPNTGRVTVETRGGLLVTVDSKDVTGLTRRPLVAEEYVDRARVVADTIEAREDLAEWCRENGLPSQRREQFRAIVKLDPKHVTAHKTLGHVQRDGRWMTRDEAAKADGLVKVGRKWVTPEEAALIQQIDASSERARAWFPKARGLKKQLQSAPAQDIPSLLTTIASNDDPDALAAWVEHFGGHPVRDVRLAAIAAFGRMSHPPVVLPLSAMAVKDVDPDVRRSALQAIPRRHAEIAVEHLVDWLTDRDNALVNRAAAAIGQLPTDLGTSQLIRALETGHWRTVTYIDNTPSFAVGGGNIGYGPTSQTLPPEVVQGLQTGQYPYGVQVVPDQSRVRTKRIRVMIHNPEVLRALVATTGQNFGYDENAWWRWWRINRP